MVFQKKNMFASVILLVLCDYDLQAAPVSKNHPVHAYILTYLHTPTYVHTHPTPPQKKERKKRC